MKKLLPLGISNYETLISGNYYYVDKTLLIKDIDEGGNVLLITRPRRFGKTLNMSMLQYFFELSGTSHAHLFSNTAIWKHQAFREKQGQFPVIFITFKDILQTNYKEIIEDIGYTIAREFDRLAYLTEGSSLTEAEKDRFNRIKNEKCSLVELGNSLEFLVRMLYKHHQKKVIVLLDEYDVPIQNAYLYSFYDKLIPFIKKLLSGPLKDQNFLEKGVVTGNLTLARAGIFTGLNNLTIHNILQSPLSDKFGFTSTEVAEMLAYYEYDALRSQIQSWYNGYTFGDTRGIHNPWSLINCIYNKGDLRMYWAHTSDNVLLRKLIGRSSPSTKTQLEQLLQGQPVTRAIEESIIFPDLDKKLDLIWSILLFTGYLTYSSYEVQQGKVECNLIIPNEEIRFLYTDLINQLFSEFIMGGQVAELLTSVIEGNTEVFTHLLQSFVMNSMSSLDIPDNEPERSYHLFVLGLLNALSNTYIVKSNREGGLGRYDISLIPKVAHQPGIIIEFKKVWPKTKKSLEQMAQIALDQIIERDYLSELRNHKVEKIIAYGIGFQRKKVAIKSMTF